MNVVALPATLLFGLATFLMLRARTVRILEALIVGLFGFTLASSMFGAMIRAVLTTLFTTHAAKNGIPVAPGAPVTSPLPPGYGPSITGPQV